MRLALFVATILPLVLGAKELLDEELPSKNPLDEEANNNIIEEKSILSDDDGTASMVKRSISDIAARRRSALDKNFMRFGRSDPSISDNTRVKLSAGNLMRFGRAKTDNFLRFGRAKSQNVMRFGRASNNLMRFGRSPSNLMRFGRGNNNLMRFGRSGNNLMRFGRANNNLMRFGRSGNLMRFGRSSNNLMRFGRSGNDDDFFNYDTDSYDEGNPIDDDLDNGENENFPRTERATDGNRGYNNINEEDVVILRNPPASKNSNKKNPMYYDDAFLRLGRITTDNPIAARTPDDESFDFLFPSEESRRKRSLPLDDDPQKCHDSACHS